ncbi:hypothetical protein KFE80_12190 [bacterium SCSIO 12696]|nr:hypothetical protein KFE80_12190 [bacterium SCSIO 12696]
MSEDNPYQAPQADVVQPQQAGERQLVAPQACSAGSGWRWLAEAFSLFSRSAGMWIVVCLVLMGISLVSGVVPLGSVALSLFSYVLVAGMMLGCQSLEQGGELSVEHLFRGFKHEAMGSLVICGAVVLGVSILLMVFMFVGAFVFAGMVAAFADLEQQFLAGSISLGLVLMILIGTALMTWFAPALIVFHRLSAWDAMKQSFLGCLKNIVPFLVYGLFGLLLMIPAAITFGLALLVLVPVGVITMYTSYKAVFTQSLE